MSDRGFSVIYDNLGEIERFVTKEWVFLSNELTILKSRVFAWAEFLLRGKARLIKQMEYWSVIWKDWHIR